MFQVLDRSSINDVCGILSLLRCCHARVDEQKTKGHHDPLFSAHLLEKF